MSLFISVGPVYCILHVLLSLNDFTHLRRYRVWSFYDRSPHLLQLDSVFIVHLRISCYLILFNIISMRFVVFLISKYFPIVIQIEIHFVVNTTKQDAVDPNSYAERYS